MSKYAYQLIKVASDWIGYNEKDGSHKKIIDLYNAHKPLARGYKVKYTDEWCATFVSACAIKAGMTDIIPTECSCQKMIELFKDKGSWNENENCVPSAGDIIFYDWQDKEYGDNLGWADHVGIVESCDGKNIVVIEGNYNETVKRRIIKVDGKYIRGFGVPKYSKEPVKSTSTPTINTTTPTKIVATRAAQNSDKSLAGRYKVTASALHLRNGAGVTHKSLTTLPKNTIVRNYGYYTSVLGTKWLYVQVTINSVQYTGFSSSKYLQKI
jgi:hypothetical protein